VAITIACHSTYASSSHSGFRNAAANAAGREVPVEPAPGCEVEPRVDPDGESEFDAADPPAGDEADPPADEPPTAEAPEPDVVLPEWPPGTHEEEEPETPEKEGEDNEDEKSRFESGGAGTASESTNTSPRMCSTYWAGTPGWFTGWVNTTCNPVAVTVSSPEPDPPAGAMGSSAPGVVVVLD
jgi:hypothetical protein